MLKNRTIFGKLINDGKLFFVGLLLATTHMAQAQTMGQIIADDELKIDITLNTDKPILRQQVVADIKVSSIYPFANTIVIPYIDSESGVVKNDDEKVNRSISNVNGNQWFTQNTKLYIYPTSEGTIELPSFTLPVELIVGEEQVLTGEISSQPVAFQAQEKKELKRIDNYIVSPNAELSLNVVQSDESKLEIGDAVKLTYQLLVADSHLMMLPDIELETIVGTEMYRKPATKENILNRLTNKNTAKLTQEFTVIFHNNGEVTVPAKTLYWWDSKNNQLQELTTEEQVFTVGEVPIIDWIKVADKFNNAVDVLGQYAHYLLFSIVFVFAIGRSVAKHRHGLVGYFRTKKKMNDNKLQKRFLHSVAERNYKTAVNVYYKLAKNREISQTDLTSKLDLESVVVWKKLLNLGFQNNATGLLSTSEAQTLLSALNKQSELVRTKFSFDWNLNPHK
jgi:hypothetical protein